jgi:hypothetical protein
MTRIEPIPSGTFVRWSRVSFDGVHKSLHVKMTNLDAKVMDSNELLDRILGGSPASVYRRMLTTRMANVYTSGMALIVLIPSMPIRLTWEAVELPKELPKEQLIYKHGNFTYNTYSTTTSTTSWSFDDFYMDNNGNIRRR